MKTVRTGKMRKGYFGYSNYQFRDKDLDIDKLRTIIQGLAQLEGVKFGTVCKRISEKIGMSPNTLWNWFEGATMMPRHAGIQAVAKAIGKEFRLMDTSAKVVTLSDYRRAPQQKWRKAS